MKAFAIIACTLLGLSAQLSAQAIDLGRLNEACHVSFPIKTQAGPMSGTLAVCRLETEQTTGTSLYVVGVYEKEYAPEILRIFKHGHSPIMELEGERISILFTSGANTTCVAEFSIASGLPEYLTTETIAWNDGGIYRTSSAYPRYQHLIEKRAK